MSKCVDVTNEAHLLRTVYRSVQDMRAAIRWAKGNASTLRIDTTKIIVGGNSAGSMMAMHAAYGNESLRAAHLPSTYNIPATILPPYTGAPDLGCLDCTGNNYTNSTEVAMLFNFWGAVIDTTWITPALDMPVYSVFGTDDFWVNPNYDEPFDIALFPKLYGSYPIHDRLNNIGTTNSFHAMPGQPHEPWLLDSATDAQIAFDTILEGSSYFAYEHFL